MVSERELPVGDMNELRLAYGNNGTWRERVMGCVRAPFSSVPSRSTSKTSNCTENLLSPIPLRLIVFDVLARQLKRCLTPYSNET